MSGGPWEDFRPRQAAPEAGPWLDFAPKAEAGGLREAIDRNAPGADAAAVGRGIINGVPIIGPALLGGVERTAAGVRSLQSGQPYADELRRVQDFSATTARENPGATHGGEIVGGVVGTLPAIAAAPAAFGAGTAALPVRAIASTLTGAGIGGADTAARGGGVEEAGKGALVGGILGTAAPFAGAAIGKAVGAFTGKPSGADRLLNRSLGADGLTPETAATRLAELGDAGMIADLGPNLQRQAGALAATPGEGQKVVRGAIADRMQGAGARTTEAADRALGQPADAISTVERLIAERRAAAEPMYLDAYTKAMPENGRVKAALATPAGQSAFKKAAVLAENEGIPIDPLKPTVRALDLTKRALDDMVDSAARSGNNNEARVLGGVRNLLLSGVDAAVPQYREARQAFASHAALQDAFEAGQALFERKTTPGQVAQMMKGMTEGERDLMQEGARSALADLMGTARNDALKARQVFDQGYNREKLARVIGKDQADALVADLSNEATFARTRDVVTGNSETAARTAAMGEVQRSNGDKVGIIKSLLNLKFGDAADTAVAKTTLGLTDAIRERRNADLARILTESGPDRAGAQRAFAALSRAVKAKDISTDTAAKLMNAVVRGGGQRELGGLAGLPAR